jgi:uncharacterized protein
VITYVDTSVLIKLFIDDEQGSEAAERLWLQSSFVVCAQIGYAESRAALAAMRRNERLTVAELREAKKSFEDLWTQMSTVPVSSGIVQEAGDLAEKYGLRGYDAVHLAAARATEVAVFATADVRLLEAARQCGFAVSNPNAITP